MLGIILYRGFCLGYTISSCILAFGTSKGLAFILSSLLLQNIILIPSILALGVSGIKLYKSIIKDRKKENVKLEIIRHTAFSCLMIIALLISSIMEIFVSNNLLQIVIKYI